MMETFAPLNGVINVYKEKGFTSQDCLTVLKGILKVKKVGHTGTLDPAAEGVLPVCVGKATRAAELIQGKDKEYVAELTFGAETSTQDATGEVIKTYDYSPKDFDETKVREAVTSFIPGYDQIPPMVSALHKDGKRLYDLARAGITVEREARPVRISEIEILKLSPEGMTIRVRCGKGTYIRALAEDIGRKIGCGAYMQSLVRTKSGPFAIEESLKLSEIEAMVRKGRRSDVVTSVEVLFEDYPRFVTPAEDDGYLLNGNYLTYPVTSLEVPQSGTVYRMETSAHEFKALYRLTEFLAAEDGTPTARLRPYKVF